MLTEDQKNALREALYSKSIRELVEMIIDQQEELQEAKTLRSRMMKIRNLVLEPGERNKPGRPRKRAIAETEYEED